MIYLNNAATTWPKPDIVYDTIYEAVRNPFATLRSSSPDAPRGEDALGFFRKEISSFFNISDPGSLVFTPGCTYSLNMAVSGLPWKNGDRVLISALEHHAVSRPVRKLVRERGGSIHISPYSRGFPMNMTWLEDELKKGGVRLVACTMASNVTGEIVPVKEIVQLAHRYGAWCLVDAAQGAGKLPVNVTELDCDMLAAPGHKGLMGPTGVGILYVKQGIPLHVVFEGGTGGDSGKHAMSDTLPNSFEVGTNNVFAIAGLTAGVQWVQSHFSEIVKKEQFLLNYLVGGLEDIKQIEILGSKDLKNHIAVVSFVCESMKPGDLGTVLATRYEITTRAGYHCAPLAHQSIRTLPGDGTLRISPGYFNTTEEIDILLHALQKISYSENFLFRRLRHLYT